jgi:hypothetical protein
MTKDILIETIVREVMYRFEQDEACEQAVEGTAALMTSHVPSHKRAIASIEASFGRDVEYIGFGGFCLPETPRETTICAETIGYEATMDIISRKAHVILLAPSLQLLDEIAGGRDETFAAYIVTRCILWNKNVNLLLDFEPPVFRRNTFFEKVADTIGTLKDVGVGVMTYKPITDPEKDALPLVTERDIVEAYRNGRVAVRKKADAIVTPSAKDASRQLGVKID